jgi:hypothetical protein
VLLDAAREVITGPPVPIVKGTRAIRDDDRLVFSAACEVRAS